MGGERGAGVDLRPTRGPRLFPRRARPAGERKQVFIRVFRYILLPFGAARCLYVCGICNTECCRMIYPRLHPSP